MGKKPNSKPCAILKQTDKLHIAINWKTAERNLITPRKRSPRNAKSKRKGDCPVDLGREYEVEISEMSPNGEGIAKVKGFTVFVGNVKLGDRVNVKITYLDSISADAEIVDHE